MKHFYQTLFTLLIYLTTLPLLTHAQLNEWPYKIPIKIYEKEGKAQTNYRVLLVIPTDTLVAAGKMQATGNDIRFALNCEGSSTTLLDYWIESGINTRQTLIWVKLAALAANDSDLIYLYYGNPAAPAVSNFDNMFPVSGRRIVSSAEEVADTLWSFDYVEIQSGGTINLSSRNLAHKLTIKAEKIVVAGTMNGSQLGYAGGTSGNGEGPGGGQAAPGATFGGGGGGYGGDGGHGGGTGAGTGGTAYGTVDLPDIYAGSGGGKGALTPGGNGGGCFALIGNNIEVTGSITCLGADGVTGWYTGGGGSGGGILLKGNRVKATGTLDVSGGKGGSSPSNTNGGGGGAGGRIKLLYDIDSVLNGIFKINGGIHQSSSNLAQAGLKGVKYSSVHHSIYSDYLILAPIGMGEPDMLTVSPAPLCKGDTVVITAMRGYKNYTFFVNGNEVQTGPQNKYIVPAIDDGAQVYVAVVDDKDCANTAKTISVKYKSNGSAPSANFTVEKDRLDLAFTPAATGMLSYSWDFGDGNSSDLPNPTHSYDFAGYYKVCLTVTNDCRPVTNCQTIAVDTTELEVFAPGNLSPNGLPEIYPNPGHGKFYVEFKNSSDQMPLTLTIFNSLGELALTKTMVADEKNWQELNLSELTSGIYFLNIKSTGYSTVKKLIVSNY